MGRKAGSSGFAVNDGLLFKKDLVNKESNKGIFFLREMVRSSFVLFRVAESENMQLSLVGKRRRME